MSGSTSAIPSVRKCSRFRLPSIASCDDITISAGSSGSPIVQSISMEFDSSTQSKHDNRKSDVDDNNNNNGCTSVYLSKLLDSNELDTSPVVFNDSDSNNFSCVSMKTATPLNGRIPSQKGASSQKKNNRASHSHKPAEIFRKDLISAMKIPDTSSLLHQEYWVMQDPWRIEWEKGVQVPVNLKSIPSINVRKVPKATHGDFRMPRKMVKSCPEPGDNNMINWNILADSTCRYDLDEMDVIWLEEINNERTLMGMQPLDEFSMEQIMEELETQCHENMQIAIQTKEGLGIEYDEDVVCDVCRLPDSEETNEMVFCDGCNLCVHQACYGILKVPEGNWLCRPCSLGIRGSATCIFCDRKGGAMKSTRSGNKWAHVSCALWIPEISIADPDRMEPITKVSHIPSSRWALLCSLCKDRVGACIQCSVKHCVTAYHVTCAIEAKLDMIADYADGSQSDGSDEPVIFRSYCEKHSKNRKDNNSEEEKSDEERRNDRQHRIMELEEEFYTLVKASAVENRLSIPIETAQQVMDYWKLKRKANFNRPLITPKHEEDTALAEAAETNLQRRLRMFTHLRQDLERVRNLCYMIGRREKTKRATVKNMESVFLTQMKLLERRMCHDSNYDTRKMLTTLQTFGQPYVCDLARKESLLLAKTPEWSQPSEVGSSRAATPVQVETNGKNGTEQQVRVSKVDQKNDETASEPLSSELKLKEDSMKVTRNGLYRRNFLSTGRKRDRTAFENNNEKNTLRSTKVESDSHQRKESHERDYVQPRAEPLEQVTSARKMRRAKTQAWTAWRSTGATSSPSAFTVKTDKSTAIGVKYRTASSKAEIPISAEYKRTKVMSEISRSRSKDNGDENMPIERSVDVMERRTSSSRASYKSDEDRLIVKWDSDAVDNPDITVTPGKVHRNKDSSTAVRELRPKRSRTSKLSDGDVTNEKMSNSRRALRPSRDSTDSIKSLRPPKRLAASNAKNELGALVRSCDEDPIDIEEESMSSGQELHKRSSIDDDVTSLRKENIERPEKHLFQKCSYPVDESSVMLSISNIQKDDEDGGYRGDMDESDFETSECSRHKVRCSASTTDNRTKRKFSDNEDSSDFHNFTERRHQKLLPAKRRRLRNQFSRNRGGPTGSLFKGFNDFEDDPTKTSSASRVKKLSIETISADNTVNIEVPKNDKAAGDGQEEGTKPVATTSFVGGQSGEKPATQNLLQSFHLSYRKSYLSGVEYPTALLHNNNIYSSIGMPSMSHIPPPNVFYSSMPPPFSAVWPPLSSEQKPPYAMLYPPHLHGDIGLNKASPPHALPDSTLSPESQQKPASVAIQASDRGDGLNTAHWPVQVNAGTSCEVPTTLPLPAAAEITGENAGALQEHGKKKKKSKKSKKKKKKKKRKHKSSHSQKEDPKSDKQSTTITIHSSGNNSSDGDTSSNYDEYCVEYCSTLPGTSQEEPVLQTDNAKHVEVAPESGHVTKLEECSPDNLSANSTSPEKNVLIEVEAKKSKLLLKIDKTKIVPMPNDQSDTDPSSGSSSEVLNDEDEQQSNNVLSNDENKPFVSPLKLKLCGLKSDRTLRGGVVAREYQILESDASQDEERLQEVGDKENQEVKLSSVAMRAQAALRRLGLTSSTNPPKPRRGLRAASAREELEGDERSASFKSANVSTPKNASELLKDDAESENLESKKRGRTRKTESDEIQIPASSNIASTSSVCQPEVRSVEVSKPIRRSTFPPTSPPPQHPPVRHWKKKKVIEHETSITTDPLQEMAPMQDVVGISAAPALPSSSQPPKQFPSSRTLPSATSFSNSRVAASSSIPNKETPILSSIISSRDSPTCSNMEGAPPIKVKDKPLYGLSVTKRPLNNNIDVEKSNPWKVTRTPPIDGLPPVSPYKFTVTTKYPKKTAASSIHGKDRVAGIGRLLSKGSSNHNQETPEAKSSISDPYEFADFGT